MAPAERGAARRQLCLLRVVGSTVSRAHRRVDDCRLLLCESHRAVRRQQATARAPDAVARHQSRLPRRVQVLQLLHGLVRCDAAGARVPSDARRGAPHPAAAWHFVLHVPGSRLHRRRVQQEARAGRLPDRLRALHQSVPALDCRSDSAPLAPAAAGAGTAPVRQRTLLQRPPADPVRPVSENGHRGQLRAHRRRGVLGPNGPTERRGRHPRYVCVRVADLWRLQRLQRHRARQRAAARLSLHGELPPALPRDEPAGLLAAMAHQSQLLAA